jgi:hypothetical protein
MVGVAEEHPSAHCEHRVLPRESDEGPCGGDTISTHLTRDRLVRHVHRATTHGYLPLLQGSAGSVLRAGILRVSGVHDQCIEEIKF